jgi:hypothetical protein
MNKNSPLNFGMMGNSMGNMYSGAYGNMSDEDLRSQYDTYSSMNPMMSGAFQGQRTAMQAEIERRQTLGSFGMPPEPASTTNPTQAAAIPEGAVQAASNAAQAASGDPCAGTAVGNAPIATAGNFSPSTQFAGSRLFGSPNIANKKPLINL